MNSPEISGAGDMAQASIARTAAEVAGAAASGFYTVECIGADGELKWRDTIENVVCTEGMESMLTNFLKGSAFTAAVYLGLIEATGYGYAGANGTGVTKGALAGSITAAGGASPANGWNEAPSSVCASRGTPSFGSTSISGVNVDLATSTSVSMSMLATSTIKGCFLLVKTKAGTSPSATVGNTSGALLSCGLFSGGDRAVINGDTLNVTYTSRLTTT